MKIHEIDTESIYEADNILHSSIYNMYENYNLLNYNLKIFITTTVNNLTNTQYIYNSYNYKNKNYLKIVKQFLDYNQNILKKINLNTIILKIKKKQLYSNIVVNNMCKKLITNGMILKKINIFKKNQKKNNKISSINLKKISEYLHSGIKMKNICISIYGSKYNVLKLSNTVRTIFKKFNITYIYSPQNKNTNEYKKIKSIKKKLKKKYTNNV